MSKKHALRLTVAGVLAVLTVTGNLIAPTQFGIPLAPPTIIASADDEGSAVDKVSEVVKSAIASSDLGYYVSVKYSTSQSKASGSP